MNGDGEEVTLYSVLHHQLGQWWNWTRNATERRFSSQPSQGKQMIVHAAKVNGQKSHTDVKLLQKTMVNHFGCRIVEQDFFLETCTRESCENPSMTVLIQYSEF